LNAVKEKRKHNHEEITWNSKGKLTKYMWLFIKIDKMNGEDKGEKPKGREGMGETEQGAELSMTRKQRNIKTLSRLKS